MMKGDIVLIPFPFTDLSGTKNRPALILVSGELDLVVAFITSQIKWQEFSDIKVESSTTNGLKGSSLIRLAKLATLDRDLILGKLGNLSQNDLMNVDLKLISILQLGTYFNQG